MRGNTAPLNRDGLNLVPTWKSPGFAPMIAAPPQPERPHFRRNSAADGISRRDSHPSMRDRAGRKYVEQDHMHEPPREKCRGNECGERGKWSPSQHNPPFVYRPSAGRPLPHQPFRVADPGGVFLLPHPHSHSIDVSYHSACSLHTHTSAYPAVRWLDRISCAPSVTDWHRSPRSPRADKAARHRPGAGSLRLTSPAPTNLATVS